MEHGGDKTHAGDIEETGKTSLLEVTESSELLSTFNPKSYKMQFQNFLSDCLTSG